MADQNSTPSQKSDLGPCISACWEKDRLGIRQGWCWTCVHELRAKWRDENRQQDAKIADLLSALRDIIGVISADDLIPETVSYMRQARAAITKAEGR